MAEVTRERAERICQAHGWKLLEWAPARRGADVNFGEYSQWLSLDVLAALDPDRPPTFAQLQRLWNGCNVIFDSVINTENHAEAETLIAEAWALGAEPFDQPDTGER